MALTESSQMTLTVLPNGAIEFRQDATFLRDGVEAARQAPRRRAANPETLLTDPAERAAATAAIAVLTAALR